MAVLWTLMTLGPAALLLPGASPAKGQAGFTWRQQIHVHGPQDVIGPSAGSDMITVGRVLRPPPQ